MNLFTSPHNLPRLEDLLQQRESQLISLINNLKIADLKEESNYEETASEIKSEILLSPIVTGEITLIGDEFFQRDLSFEQQVLGQSRNVYVHELLLPFTGSEELFRHRPESYSYTSSGRGLMIPNTNSITIEVELPVLNVEQAKTEALNMLSMTLAFAKTNSNRIRNWLPAIESAINSKLKSRKEDLIRLYGK